MRGPEVIKSKRLYHSPSETLVRPAYENWWPGCDIVTSMQQFQTASPTRDESSGSHLDYPTPSWIDEMRTQSQVIKSTDEKTGFRFANSVQQATAFLI
jgi:hypothetical protein